MHRARPLLLTLLLALTLPLSCDSVEKAERRPEPVRIERPERRPLEVEVPQIMRGTVASEAVVLGYRDVVVRGFGLVVGLRGTGSRALPSDVRAFMLQEMGRKGVGLPPLDEFTPDELLNSLDTAVVVVEGIVPAGSPRGTPFDVRVYVASGTTTTSLEGGRLYTCDLRPGQLSSSNRQPGVLATAKGPVFVNPFIEPRSGSTSRLSGRILDGGLVQRSMPIKLRLYTPSHNRSATVQTAINSNFPREPGQDGATARGESDESVRIWIPPSYATRTREFIELMRHTTLSLDAPELVAIQIRRALLANPSEDEAASWRWQALGVRTLPTLQELYTYPEESPRLAALRAGARLNDSLVVPHLISMAAGAPQGAPSGSAATLATESSSAGTASTPFGEDELRLSAIELLTDHGVDPRIDAALREMLQEPNVDIRSAAFTALAKRLDPVVRMRRQGSKFELWTGPSIAPTLFISQSGAPRVAIASNEPVRLDLPITLQAWSGRIMIKGDYGDDHVEVFYRTGAGAGSGNDRIIVDAPVDLMEFVEFLARRSGVDDPRPGLDLSYGEVVGLLYEMVKAKAINVDFKTEQDRLMAAILRLEQETAPIERPEFGDPDFDFLEADETISPEVLDDGSLRPLADPALPQPAVDPRGGIVPR